MHLDIYARSGVHIDRLVACPSLEILWIKIQYRKSPTTEFNHVYLYPLWRLLCLWSFRVYGLAPILFNFDSLDYMPALELLELDASEDKHLFPLESMPHLSAYRCRPQLSSGEEDEIPAFKVHKWKDQWDLPRLTYLYLSELVSSVFCFNWVKQCPSLKYLCLITSGDYSDCLFRLRPRVHPSCRP